MRRRLNHETQKNPVAAIAATGATSLFFHEHSARTGRFLMTEFYNGVHFK